MIFRLTQSLNARVKAGKLEAMPLYENPLRDWSAHMFPVGRSRFILLSNTGSLLSAVVSGQGVTNLKSFRDRAFDGIRACLTALGYESISRTVIPDDNGPVRFAKASNRSVSGSMNELVKCAEFCMSEGELTLPDVGHRLNDTLLSALATSGTRGYGKPKEAFRVLAGGAGSPASTQPDRASSGTRRTPARLTRRGAPATSFGRLVPDAGPVNPSEVTVVGFMVSDKTAGAFKLEVGRIGVEQGTGP